MPWQIERFYPKCEDEGLWQAYTAFKNELGKEASPDDPPLPAAFYRDRMRNKSAHDVERIWFVRGDDKGIAATARAGYEDRAENRHIIHLGINVRADLRRRGLGRRLLAVLAGFAREAERPSLVTHTVNTMPAGRAFIESTGATCGQVFHINQLVLSEVDRALLHAWQERARERAGGFELVRWDDRIPEDQLQAVCDLTGVMATAPRDDLKMEDWKITPEQMREYERVRADLKIESWVIAAREKATGTLAGYTHMNYDPAEPHLLHQGDTGVWPQYRALGLGRWLKAAMLERALAKKPEARFVRTGNAGSNAPMLKINHTLGFKLYIENSIWQIPLETIDAYIEKTDKR